MFDEQISLALDKYGWDAPHEKLNESRADISRAEKNLTQNRSWILVVAASNTRIQDPLIYVMTQPGIDEKSFFRVDPHLHQPQAASISPQIP